VLVASAPPVEDGVAHGVAAHVEFESKVRKRFHMFKVQALRFRRFQHGFDRFNLHRLTMGWSRPPARAAQATRNSMNPGAGTHTPPLFSSTQALFVEYVGSIR
jgi:hypothetical protein